jgi:hypothetical protein
MFSLLKPTFSLLLRPQQAHAHASRTRERSSTEIPHENSHDMQSPIGSVEHLVPFIIGTQALDQ